MRLQPTSNRVIVKQDEDEQITKGGIHIPDTAKERPSRGDVVAVGPGKIDPHWPHGEHRLPMMCRVGSTVYFSAYSANKLKVDGEEYLVLSEDDIIAIEK